MSLLGLSYGDDDEGGSGRSSLQSSAEGLATFSIVDYGNDEASDHEKESKDNEQTANEGDRMEVQDNNAEVSKSEEDGPGEQAPQEEGSDELKNTEESGSNQMETEQGSKEARSLTTSEKRRLVESLLPPRPTAPCEEKLAKKVTALRQKVMRGQSVNERIRHGTEFKNPYILNWLVDHCGIDEVGSNYPPELFDPHAIREQIAALQQKTQEETNPPPAPGPYGRAIAFATGGTQPPPTLAAAAPPVASTGGGGVVVKKRSIAQATKGDTKTKKTEAPAAKKSKWDQTERPPGEVPEEGTESSATAAPTPAPAVPAVTTTTASTESSVYAQFVQRKREEAAGK